MLDVEDVFYVLAWFLASSIQNSINFVRIIAVHCQSRARGMQGCQSQWPQSLVGILYREVA